MNKYLFPMLKEEVSLPVYVKGVGGLENQDHILRPNGYFDYQWIHCIKGKGLLKIEGLEYLINRNSGFFLSPNIPHEYYALESPWETHWVTFDGSGVKELLKSLGFKSYGVYLLDDIRPVDSLIYDIFIISQSKGILTGHKCSAKLYSLLMELRIQISEQGEKVGASKHNRLQPVLSFIEENYFKSPTIDEMAGIIGVSSQYLCRLFNEVLNIRPSMYLNLIKLQKAKEIMLLNFRATIREVSEQIGFSDPSYFCAIFKKYEGLSPMEFRKIYNENN